MATTSTQESNAVQDAARAVVTVTEQLVAVEETLARLEAASEVVAQAAAAQALGEDPPAGAEEARALLAQEPELRATHRGLTQAQAKRARAYGDLLAERTRARRDQLARELNARTSDLDRRATEFQREAQREQTVINDLRQQLLMVGADVGRAEKRQVAELVTKAAEAAKEAE